MKFNSCKALVCAIGLAFVFFGCSKEFSVETGASLAAQGSLYDAFGNCMTDSVAGTYYDGIVPGQDTDYVMIKVNVTTAGTFNITSDVQNGVYFADSGYFTNTGVDTIKLLPVGTPIIPGSNTYTITFDSSTCNFTVLTKDSTGTNLGGNNGGGNNGGGNNGGGTGGSNLTAGQWVFTAPSGQIVTGSAVATFSGNQLSLLGQTVTGDTTLTISINFPSSAPSQHGAVYHGLGRGAVYSYQL